MILIHIARGKDSMTRKTETATVTEGVKNSVMILIHIARGKSRATVKTEAAPVTEGVKDFLVSVLRYVHRNHYAY